MPDFTDVDIGIARTQPRYDGQTEVREVEALFLDSIEAARAHDLHREPVLTVAPIARARWPGGCAKRRSSKS